MVDEATKTSQIRGENFAERYLSGRVIDIGAGEDLVVPHAEPFDKEHGDSNYIDQHLEPESFDCVHSSHCLEHMDDPEDAIARWWRLVKPGGYLIVIVPDEDLYEQGVWPSRFNPEHKATFSLDKSEKSWSPCSFDLRSLVEGLPGADIISAEVQDQHYDHSMLRLGPENEEAVYLRFKLIELRKQLIDRDLMSMPLLEELNRFFFQHGVTVDQTLGLALAQIQVIAQKLSILVPDG